MVSVRICYECEFCTLDPASQGYSELTPGESASISCDLDHWRISLAPSRRYTPPGEADTQELATCLEKARTCPDFSLAKWARPE